MYRYILRKGTERPKMAGSCILIVTSIGIQIGESEIVLITLLLRSKIIKLTREKFLQGGWVLFLSPRVLFLGPQDGQQRRARG